MKRTSKPLRVRVTPEAGRDVQFVQLENRAIIPFDDLIRRAPLSGRLMLRLIGMLQGGSAGVIVVSRHALAEMLAVSLKTVERAIKLLAAEGWIQRLKVGSAWGLAVNRRVAWVGPRDQRYSAAFDGEVVSATLVLARSEQDALALDPPRMREVPVARLGEIVSPVGEPTPPAQTLIPGTEPVARTGEAPESRTSAALQHDRHAPRLRGRGK